MDTTRSGEDVQPCREARAGERHIEVSRELRRDLECVRADPSASEARFRGSCIPDEEEVAVEAAHRGGHRRLPPIANRGAGTELCAGATDERIHRMDRLAAGRVDGFHRSPAVDVAPRVHVPRGEHRIRLRRPVPRPVVASIRLAMSLSDLLRTTASRLTASTPGHIGWR